MAVDFVQVVEIECFNLFYCNILLNACALRDFSL